jgi:amidase
MKTPYRMALFGSLVFLSLHAMADRRFDPAYATIEQLRSALDSGQISSEQLVRYYLRRIERFDKKGPRINAMISLNTKALEQARHLDAAGKSKSHKDMLYGIPFIAKDNYNTAGIPTSGGSAALKHSIPPANAFVVQKLLDQGAILIGKSNMSELATSYDRLGYSSAGGLTVNPYNTARGMSRAPAVVRQRPSQPISRHLRSAQTLPVRSVAPPTSPVWSGCAPPWV